MQHELASLFIDVVGVDEDLTDVRVEVVTNGADDQAGLLKNQVGAGLQVASVVDGLPELQQVVQVPLELVGCATNASRAGNDAHAGWHLELVHGLFEFLPVLTLDTTRHAAALGVVGHEDQVAASQ